MKLKCSVKLDDLYWQNRIKAQTKAYGSNESLSKKLFKGKANGKVPNNAMIYKDGLLYLPSLDQARRKTEKDYNTLLYKGYCRKVVKSKK